MGRPTRKSGKVGAATSTPPHIACLRRQTHRGDEKGETHFSSLPKDKKSVFPPHLACRSFHSHHTKQRHQHTARAFAALRNSFIVNAIVCTLRLLPRPRDHKGRGCARRCISGARVVEHWRRQLKHLGRAPGLRTVERLVRGRNKVGRVRTRENVEVSASQLASMCRSSALQGWG